MSRLVCMRVCAYACVCVCLCLFKYVRVCVRVAISYSVTQFKALPGTVVRELYNVCTDLTLVTLYVHNTHPLPSRFKPSPQRPPPPTQTTSLRPQVPSPNTSTPPPSSPLEPS